MFKFILRRKTLYLLILIIITIMIGLMSFTYQIFHMISNKLILTGIHIVEYNAEPNTNFSILKELSKYIVKNKSYLHCKESSYRIYHAHCCIHQFAFNYLYFLGFTNFSTLNWRKHNLMVNNKANWLGCSGFNIQQTNKEYSNKISLHYKTKLHDVIISYCTKHHIENKCKLWLPITFNLNRKQDRINFFKLLACNNKSNLEYILKSDGHHITGIRFINNSNFVRSFYLNKQEQLESNPECIVTAYDNNINVNDLHKNAVAQQMIVNLLRINDCKFHIRSFIVLANYYNPFIVLYADSIIIKAINPNSIITNRVVSKKDKNKMNSNDDWVWNMKQLNDYFEMINVAKMIKDIQNIVKIMFLAAYDHDKFDKMNMDETEQHYALMAVDLMITNDFKIKLLEINRTPASSWIPKSCFHFSTYFGYKMMEHNWACNVGKIIMEEIVNIEIEIAIKKINRYKVVELDSLNYLKPIIFAHPIDL
eukprot:549582_1